VLNKLRNRFLLMCMAVTLFVLFVSFTAVYMTMSRNIQSENKSKLENAVLSTEQSAMSESVAITTERNRIGSTTTNLPTFTLIINDAGIVLEKKTSLEISDSSFDEVLNIVLVNPRNAEVKIADKVWIYDVSNIPILDRVGEQGYLVQGYNKQITFLDITDSINLLNSLLVTLAAVGLVTMVFVFLFSLFLSNHSIKPVKQAWDKQRRFVADASHELKTPLSIIKSNYDAILDEKTETIESQLEWFGYMKTGMDRMEKLILTLLTLARIEDTKNNMAKEPFDIGKLIQAAIEPFETRIKEKDINLSCDLTHNITVYSNKNMVADIFRILFDNAVKYTNNSGYINVKLWHEKRSILFSVGNTGNNILKADLTKIFERFYRTDASRSSETGGHGLGLAIAKETVTQLGGRIKVDSRDGWTVFSVMLF